ncbi:MAG: MFS transporter, partial [Myxococcota bacterium]
MPLFLVARLVSSAAIQIQSVTIGWEVYNRTGDPLALAVVGLAQFLPLVLLSLYAGSFADRNDRRLTLAVCRGLYAVGALALALLSSRDGTDVWPIYVVLVGLGATRAFSWSAGSSLLPNLVPTHSLSRAIALSSTAFQVATIGGPALAGLVLSWVGASGAYTLSAALSVVGVVLVLALRPRPFVPVTGESGWARLLGGLRFVFRKRIVLGAISLDLFAVLLGGAVALMPIYAEDILKVGTTGFGLLRSAPAVGALVVALMLASRPMERRAGLKMFIGVGLFGVGTLIFALSTNFVLSLAALVLIGAADMVSVVVRLSLIQLHTPDGLRGRVSAVNMVFIGASNELGEFESGVTARLFGTVRAAVIGGVGTLIITGVWAGLFPELREIDR